jgi:hypothetical protein
MRLTTFLLLFLVGVSIGIVIDHYVISQRYSLASKSAEIYYNMLLTLNGFGTYFFPRSLSYFKIDSLPIVIGQVTESSCFKCVGDELLILRRYLSDGKIGAVFFVFPYRDTKDQIVMLNKFKEFNWVGVFPIPDSNFTASFGKVGKSGGLYFPMYRILGKDSKFSFFASVGDTSLFKDWLEQGLESLKKEE